MDVFQPCVRDSCAVEIQYFQIEQALDARQPGIGNLCSVEKQMLHVGQFSDMLYFGVGNFVRCVTETDLKNSSPSSQYLRPNLTW